MPPNPPTPSVEAVARAIRGHVFADTEEAQELSARQYISNRDDLLARAAILAYQAQGEGGDVDAATGCADDQTFADVPIETLREAADALATAPPRPSLLEQLHAGCDCSVTCQLLHQAAAEALGKMREALEPFARVCDAFDYWMLEVMPTFTYPVFGTDTSLALEDCPAAIGALTESDFRRARQSIQDTPTLTGPNDSASLYAAARAMAEHDWRDELVRDVWAELHPWEQEYYLDHARIARGGTAVRVAR